MTDTPDTPKPREFWLYESTDFRTYAERHETRTFHGTHVIEFSAYDALETQLACVLVNNGKHQTRIAELEAQVKHAWVARAHTDALEKQVAELRKQNDKISACIKERDECEKHNKWLKGALHEQKRCHNIEYQRAEDLNRKLAAAEAEIKSLNLCSVKLEDKFMREEEAKLEVLQWCEKLASTLKPYAEGQGAGYLYAEHALAEFEAWRKCGGK